MSPAAETYDVAIVGCGPVGALCAALVAQRGLRTVVIERATDVYDLPRAIHFDAQVMRLFQQAGIADGLVPLTREWRRSVFTGADGDVLRVHEFSRERVEGWAPHVLFYQPELERLLREGAGAHGADLRLGVELVDFAVGDDGVTLGLHDGDAVQASWVIGCDGASSTVRRRLGITLDDLHFDEPWLVIDAFVADPAGLPSDSRMVCDPRRPATLIEGRGTHRRWEFMLLPGEDPATAADPDNVRRLIGEWIDPAGVDVVRAAVYRFHGLVATRWRHGRVLLAGDAAHQTPPFLGQGMCHGMRDVSNLAWKLSEVAAGRAPVELLDTYEAERKPHVAEIVAMSVASGRDICILDAQRAAERDRAVREQAAAGALPPSPFAGMPPLRHGLFGAGTAAGFLFPQPVVTVGGAEARLDDVLGTGWAIVTEGVAVEADDRAESAARGVPVVVIGEDVDDSAAVVRRWMDSRDCRAVLVRPDRYVYASGRHVGAVIAAAGELPIAQSAAETRA